MEERQIMRISEVDLSLASLDVLEPDLVLEVNATDCCRGDHHLTKPPVENLRTLSQRHMGAFRECFRRDKIAFVMLQELRFLTQLYLELIP